MNPPQVIIVGAGPAGLLAAGSAAMAGAKVLVVEKMRQAGRKLLITGKGRCNITNQSDLDEYFKHIFPDPRFLRSAFHGFFHNDIVDLLNNNGLKTQLERGNRVFPESNKSADVLGALMKWIEPLDVKFRYNCQLKSLLIQNGRLEGVMVDEDGIPARLSANTIILATGGKSYPATGSNGEGYILAASAGHHIVTPRPALVPLVTKGKTAGDLQGLSLKNINASIRIDGKKAGEEFGEMMFAHFGLTGPVILSLSRMAVDALNDKKNVEISLDLKPALDESKLDKRLLRDLDAEGNKQLDNIFRNWLPVKLIPVFLEILKLDPRKKGHQLTGAERKSILALLKDFRFRVIDYRGFREAIITAGGVDTSEINGRTMESRILPGLFFAGEIIDLDANTGGFNLQIAWSTGWLAGSEAAARALSQ